MVAAMMPGSATGMNIRSSICMCPAPSISAASSSSLGIDWKYPIMIQVQNGTVSVGYTSTMLQ